MGSSAFVEFQSFVTRGFDSSTVEAISPTVQHVDQLVQGRSESEREYTEVYFGGLLSECGKDATRWDVSIGQGRYCEYPFIDHL